MSAVPEVGADSAAGAGGRRWSFDKAVFDERSFELRVNGRPVDLERKSLEVLRQLLYRAGEVVTKDELLELVWPGRIVSESVPAKCISRIREAIGDDAQAIIKTAHGYGYRLVASVKVETSRAAPALTRLDLKAGDHPPLRPLWSLVRQLGAGGQGEIWLVRHDKTHEERVYKFALDVPGLAAIKREITLSRFLRETLEGRDEFIRVLDWNLEEAPYYLELEHASGNLDSWADAQGGLAKMPLPTRLEVVAKIADALAAAHSVGVLHKDLKPSNVLIASGSDGAPKVKLTDFGSGGVLDPARLEALGITRLGFTQSIMQGEAAATAMYLAPEVMSGQPATVQADIYALGVLLYQMVAGDLRVPLAPGWEHRVDDPLLSEDIAIAVAGDPARRLADASALAARLRTLENRRRQREAEQAERLRLEQEQRAAEIRARKAELAVERLRTRRAWQRTVLAILIVAVSISLGLFLQARRAQKEAALAAASSQAVADFLSKDMFSVVTAKPLRELSVRELLEAAAATLSKRVVEPQAAAAIHTSLGSAFWTMEMPNEAAHSLRLAFDHYEERHDPDSAEAAAKVAAQLAAAEFVIGQFEPSKARFEAVLERSAQRLGSSHLAVLNLRKNLAHIAFARGDWRDAAGSFRRLLDDAATASPVDRTLIAGAQQQQGFALLRMGRFEEAQALLAKSVEQLSAAQGVSQLPMVDVRVVRAMSLVELERFAEAEAELEQSQQVIRKWASTDTVSHAALVDFGFGRLRLRQNRVADAVRHLRHAIAVLLSTQYNAGADHSAELRLWLALALRDAGNLADAAQEMRRAIDLNESTLGKSHPISQYARIGLADIVRMKDGAKAARAALAEVDQEALGNLGADHLYRAEMKRVEGLAALALEDAVARRALQESLDIFQSHYGARHALVRQAQRELARAQVTSVTP